MLDTQHSAFIQNRIDQKTKPLGALGLLEKTAFQLALIQSQQSQTPAETIQITKPSMFVFAGDHGIADEGVSIAPSAVTQQMVLNFVHGGAAINCFCRLNDIDLTVVDAGILQAIDTSVISGSNTAVLVTQRLGNGTHNFNQQAAMSLEQVEKGISYGQSLIESKIARGCNLVMFGEMGIGNTSSASAILSALTGLDAKECVGLGTGIDDEQLKRKQQVVANGVERCEGKTVEQVLSEVGGFEIVQMVGGFIGAAKAKTPILVDGFIVSVAAYVASLIEPACRDYMLFAHKSQEHAHQYVLSELNAEPMLDLGLRLGEGTGAALALPLIKAAAEFYNNMASFESAGVTV
ncbi:nicotinate-nucleotide--dimethylbenzimidazole phosphoribosyltransferase [Vibrio fortis]|uniref:Nicotinate-nucleotide--dimethylbenzimidazole phosphoribosyltransferase n=1 Tax=Vibrio fortis TaxID=212667 RepID=A0A066UVE9_9VIBR|nr:nicotinate-nucleotide--dimethylbenzimidazole phosphoribosyltransferase [Vibrio fortis]KDN29912.1 nicotinate-nucleotide--dimethylbenzimidazole phosphoribosyltransferase [Vibrio fortis]